MRSMAASGLRNSGVTGAATLVVVTSTLAGLCLLTAADARKSTRPKPSFKLFRTKLIPKLYNFEHCEDREHSLRVVNVSTSMDHYGGESFDVLFDVLSTANSISMLKVNVQRCTGSTSSCEVFNNMRFTSNLCDLMLAKRTVWTPYMQMLKPTLKCPVVSGLYLMHNVSVDLDMVDRTVPGLSLEKYIWLTECQAYNENHHLFSCFKWQTEARRVRAKDDGSLLGLR